MAATIKDIVEITGLKLWKVQIVLGNNSSNNLHRVTDEEVASILHASADLGYSIPVRAGMPGKKVKDVTQEMVAKRAGVSRATVNQAICGSGHISRQTREHALRIARELGYKTTIRQKFEKFYNKKG